MSIFIVFSLFSISFIFSKLSSPNRVRNEGRRRLRLRKEGAKSPSSKNRVKSSLDFIAGARSLISLKKFA
jgi:hypothetical protein